MTNAEFDEFLEKATMAEMLIQHPRFDGIVDAAKSIGIDEFVFINWILDKGIVYLLLGQAYPEKWFLDSGHATTISGVAKDGIFRQVRFTQSGLDYIRKVLTA